MRARALLAVVGFGLIATATWGRADESIPPYSVRDSSAARVAIEEARAALAAGETRRGVERLQSILDHLRDDLVVVPGKEARYVSAPEVALRMIEALDAPGRALYEEIATAAARPLLDHAVAQRDEALLQEVAARFGPSSLGVEAGRRLADSAFEEGRAYDAAAAARGALRFAPRDAGLWVRLVDALDAAGDAAALARLRLPEGAPLEAPTAAGPVDVAQRLAAARARVGPVPGPVDVPQWGGDARHDVHPPWDHGLRPLRWAAGAPPPWRLNDDVPTFFGNFEPDGQGQFSTRWALATPFMPLVLGKHLVVSDGTGVTAYELLSGRVAWAFPSPEHPTPGLELVRPKSGEALAGRTNLDVAFAPASANGLVYASVEVPDRSFVPRRLNGIDIVTYLPRRILVALDASTGALVWRMGQHAEDVAALGRLSVGGPAVVADGVVAVLGVAYEERWTATLLGFDARSGRLRWTRRLVTSQQELNLFGKPIKELWAGAPAVDDGVVYAPTGLGVFVAADLRTGEIRWLASYEAQTIERVELWYATPMRLACWGPSPTVVHGDAVLVAPADSPYLYCFDRADGKMRWREPAQATRDSPFVDWFLGVSNDGKRDVAIVTGRAVRAHALKDGQFAWGARLSESALVHGRGALSETKVYVPTLEGLETYSIPGEGRLLAPGVVPWPERSRPGNLLLSQEVLVVAAGAGAPDAEGQVNPIQTFFAPEDLERAIEVRRQASPDDASLALEAADLARFLAHDARAEALYAEASKLASAAGDASVVERARQGVYLLWRERGDAATGKPGRTGDARSAYEAALARAQTAAERVSVRLRLDRLLRDRGLESARLRNLEALAAEAEDERATFDPKEGDVPARAGARFLLAELHQRAGRAADAVRVLQDVIREDGDTTVGAELARARAQRAIDGILDDAGPLPYRPFELEAARRLEEASKGTDPAPFERVLAEFPNANAVPEALLGLAERQRASGAAPAAAASLRRFLGAYPGHPDAARALASLALALVDAGSTEPARAALAALERRQPDVTFTLDGTSWTGRRFAEATRARLGAATAPRTPVPLARRPEERWFQDVDAQGMGSRCLDVDLSGAGDVAPPILVSAGDELVAVDPATARARWRKTLSFPSRAALIGDTLVIGVTGALVAVDPATGDERWRRELPGDPLDVRASLGQAVTLVRAAGVFLRTRLLAVDPVTSAIVWTRDLPGDPADRMAVGEDGIVVLRRRNGASGGTWTAAVHSPLTGETVRDLPHPIDASTELTSVVSKGRTFVAWTKDADAVRLEAFELATGRARWSRTVPGGSTGWLQRWVFLNGDEVVGADASGRLLTFSLATGEPVRETAVTGGLAIVDRAPFVDRGRLVAVVRETRLRSTLSVFDLSTGRAVWSQAQGQVAAALVLPAGDVYVAVLSPALSQMGRGRVAQAIEYQILVLDADTGTDVWRIAPKGLGGVIPSASVLSGALLVAGQRRFAVYR